MITGVVVPFATVLDKSVPVVPKVSAATLVTVPPLPVADKVPVAKEIPLPIVTFDSSAYLRLRCRGTRSA